MYPNILIYSISNKNNSADIAYFVLVQDVKDKVYLYKSRLFTFLGKIMGA